MINDNRDIKDVSDEQIDGFAEYLRQILKDRVDLMRIDTYIKNGLKKHLTTAYGQYYPEWLVKSKYYIQPK